MTIARLVGVVGAMLCVACARPPALLFERNQEHTRLAVDASAANRLTLEGGVARVTLHADSSDSVRATVSIRSTDQRRLRERCLPNARLERTLADGELVLRVRQDGRTKCGETWHVTVPRRLFVSLDFVGAEVDAMGIRGGLDVRISGTGRVVASVDSGPAFVALNVGDVNVVTNGVAVSEVFLESGVGRAELTLHGMQIPIRRTGASSRFSSRGQGSHDIRLRTRVGDVTLVIN